MSSKLTAFNLKEKSHSSRVIKIHIQCLFFVVFLLFKSKVSYYVSENTAEV